MKKTRLILTFLWLLLYCFKTTSVYSQHCSNGNSNLTRRNDSAYTQSWRQYEINNQNYNNNRTIASAGVIFIDVVVHVVHNNGIENISDAQIQSQIDALNRAYRNLRGSTNINATDTKI